MESDKEAVMVTGSRILIENGIRTNGGNVITWSTGGAEKSS